MPGHHDLGGLPAGPIDRRDHDLEEWEREIDAIRTLLGDRQRRLLPSDQLRRAIESLPPQDYLRLSYYERWSAAILALMVEKGIVSQAEFDRRVAEYEQELELSR